MTDTTSFLLVLLAAAAAPFIAAGASRLHPHVIVPIVVVELFLGALIGPDVLGLAEMDDILDFLGQLGLGFLFFFAGYEIELDKIRGKPLRLAAIGWAITLVMAYAIAGALMALGVVLSGLLVGSAMSTTALGTILPVLRDADKLETRLGRFVLGVGAVGEFGPVLIVTVLLGSQSDPSTQLLLLAVFVVLAVLAALLSMRAVGRGWEFIERNMETSGQVPVRLTVLLLFGLVVVAADLGLDVILGAFAAGGIVRLLTQGREAVLFEPKLDAVGFGLLIPFFFVTSGIKLDLEALVSSARALIELPLFLALFLVVRGLPAMLLYRDVLSGTERKALALLSATQLPLVVAITTIGVDSGNMRTSTAAALVGAGALSVLIYPALALNLVRDRGPSDPPPGPAPARASRPGTP
jgi:Kef-type K+ transport system membrane component KefB